MLCILVHLHEGGVRGGGPWVTARSLLIMSPLPSSLIICLSRLHGPLPPSPLWSSHTNCRWSRLQ